MIGYLSSKVTHMYLDENVDPMVAVVTLLICDHIGQKTGSQAWSVTTLNKRMLFYF